MRVKQRLVAMLAILAVGLVVSSPPSADGDQATTANAYTLTSSSFAVLGDTPYSATERSQFPNLVKNINADPDVSMVMHAGDIHSGDSPCDDQMYQDRFALYNTFVDPFVLTPGDNDWTDCHRVATGQYVPTERLDYLRRVLYPRPGFTLGQSPAQVETQASDLKYSKFRENVRFERSGVVFATVHVVGSNNGRARWLDLPGGDQPAVRKAEYQARDAANLAWIDAAFDRASTTGAAGVCLLMQSEPKAKTAFLAIRNKIVARAKAFRGKVLLVHGDEHRYEVETSYAGVSNLTRLETYGTTATRWLKLTVDPNATGVFSWVPRTVS